MSEELIYLLSVILMQMPGYELTIPAGEVSLDGDKLELIDNEDGTITIKLVKDEEDNAG